jgi:hypothetical protein
MMLRLVQCYYCPLTFTKCLTRQICMRVQLSFRTNCVNFSSSSCLPTAAVYTITYHCPINSIPSPAISGVRVYILEDRSKYFQNLLHSAPIMSSRAHYILPPIGWIICIHGVVTLHAKPLSQPIEDTTLAGHLAI